MSCRVWIRMAIKVHIVFMPLWTFCPLHFSHCLQNRPYPYSFGNTAWKHKVIVWLAQSTWLLSDEFRLSTSLCGARYCPSANTLFCLGNAHCVLLLNLCLVQVLCVSFSDVPNVWQYPQHMSVQNVLFNSVILAHLCILCRTVIYLRFACWNSFLPVSIGPS